MARTKRKAQKAAARQRRAEEKAAQTAAESGQSKEEAAKEEVVSAAELDVPKAKKIKLDDTSATSTVAENNDIVDTKEPSSQSQSESPQTLPDIQSAVEPPEKKEPTIAKDKQQTYACRHKRAPQRPPTLATDIYVSRRSNFIALSKRAQALLDRKEFNFVTIHGLGAAMNKAIELALHLRKQNPDRITWSITTDSVTLVDDIEPDDVDEDLTSETRQNSAIHIKVVKVINTPSQPG